MQQIISLFLPLLFITTATLAQTPKIGFTDPQQVLEKLPEFKIKQSEFEDYKKVLAKQMETKQQAFQAALQAGEAKVQGGAAPVEIQQIRENLEKMQQELVQLEQESNQKLAKKNDELITPLFDKIIKAIDDVAKEGSYDFIITRTDATGSEILLYGKEELDITNLVLKKMGVTVSE
ncbi:MAG: OmpH family outer membrane protein [Bacteroidota bacterium]